MKKFMPAKIILDNQLYLDFMLIRDIELELKKQSIESTYLDKKIQDFFKKEIVNHIKREMGLSTKGDSEKLDKNTVKKFLISIEKDRLMDLAGDLEKKANSIKIKTTENEEGNFYKEEQLGLNLPISENTSFNISEGV